MSKENDDDYPHGMSLSNLRTEAPLTETDAADREGVGTGVKSSPERQGT